MSSDCGVCGVQCSEGDFAKCSGTCGRVFHIKCVKDDMEGKKTRSYRDWKCRECRDTSSTQSSVSAVNISKEFLMRVLEELKGEVFMELKTFRNEFVEFSSSVKFISDKLDENNKFMKEMREEFSALKRENEELRSRNAGLTGEMSALRERVRTMEQYSRKDNIEISGLPVTPNEDVTSLVKDIGAAVGVVISEEDVSAAHRVPSFVRGRTPSLVVKFVRRSARDSILRKYREKKGMTARDVNPAFPQQRIFINEHLSPDNKVFLAKIKAKCKEVGYAYAWSRDGKFFVRKSQGENFKKINNPGDLESLK